jgi:hypothetical protein
MKFESITFLEMITSSEKNVGEAFNQLALLERDSINH